MSHEFDHLSALDSREAFPLMIEDDFYEEAEADGFFDNQWQYEEFITPEFDG